MNAKSRVEGHVRDVVANGDAVVETQQGIVFARGGLPGEQVTLWLDDKRGRVRRGRVASVVSASSDRVEPPCPYVERCGGCALMHASTQAQRALTTGFLRDALRKAGAPETLEVALHPSAQTLAYRSRARMAFRAARKTVTLGFHRERSHDIVDIDRCLVLSDPLSRALTVLREQLVPALQGEGELSLARGKDERAVVVLRSDGTQPSEVYACCERLVQTGELAGLALFAGGATKPATFGDPREWAVASDGAALEGPIGGFSQANPDVNARLVARVAALAETDGMRVLELYAGAGNFTVALARGAASYVAVEQNPGAVQALRQNLATRSLTVKVVEGDALLKLDGGPLDVVVLDPPRTGAPGVLPKLLARKPRRIVYVSCDPATLARDVAEVLPRGYELTSAEAFEMFPQTPDLEALVLLTRTT